MKGRYREMDRKFVGRDVILWPLFGAILLLIAGCGVKGLQPAPQVEKGRAFKNVQVVPNSEYSPDCNIAYCFMLFTDGSTQLYMPRVENNGPGRIGQYDWSGLWAFQVSDGSIVFAPIGSGPTEYPSSSGEIWIQVTPRSKGMNAGPLGWTDHAGGY
jgi:hypothetical protein